MPENTGRKKVSYDFHLVLATVGVLFAISLICIFGMFYFKWAQLQNMPPAEKMFYMNRMNTVISPFLLALIIILGICVPKRLLPVRYLNWFALAQLVLLPLVAVWRGVREALLAVLAVSLLLQTVVLLLAMAGSERLNFEKSGYWQRLGSSLIHLGLILFVFDLFFYRQQTLHLVLFWVTTVATVLGMIFSFYAPGMTALVRPREKGGEGTS